MNRIIAYIVSIGFLGLGWYSMYEVAYVEHRVVPGQEWIGFFVMGLYTLMIVSALNKMEKFHKGN